MPLEIKELIIKATVTDTNESSGGSANNEDATNEIVSQCVEQVLEILNDKLER